MSAEGVSYAEVFDNHICKNFFIINAWILGKRNFTLQILPLTVDTDNQMIRN